MRFAEQWNWCTVDSVRDVTPTIREFLLRPDGGHVAPYPAGSHIGVAVRLHYAEISRADAALLDELSAVLGDRLIVHASDECARIDLDATFRALPDDAIAVMCGPMRMLEAARRPWNAAGRAPAYLR